MFEIHKIYGVEGKLWAQNMIKCNFFTKYATQL